MFFKLSRNVVLSILLRSASFACFAVLATSLVAGDELDTIYTVPPPGQAAFSWCDRARRCGPSVMLVGDPEHFMGTAFVISSKNRLLATNAHVADKFYELGSMLALSQRHDQDLHRRPSVAPSGCHSQARPLLGDTLPGPVAW